jgi:hypothetical protein
VVPSGLEKAEAEEARAEGRVLGGRRAPEYAFRKDAYKTSIFDPNPAVSGTATTGAIGPATYKTWSHQLGLFRPGPKEGS